MAHFDRFDICAAWNLYLQHHSGDGSIGSAGSRQDQIRCNRRLAQLRKSFTPSEEYVSGLSENALEIYTRLCANAGTLERVEHPIANTPSDGESLFLMWAGSTQVYVWANHFEDAFETLVEWLDDNAPGCLVSHEEAHSALQERIDALNGDLEGIEDLYEELESRNDWTVIGHTSLTHGGHIPSYEWGGDEVSESESDAVRLASTEAYAEHFRAVDRAAAVAECEQVFMTYDPCSQANLAMIKRIQENALACTGKFADLAGHPALQGELRYGNRMRHAALITLLCQIGTES